MDEEALFAGLLSTGYCYVQWTSRRALIDFGDPVTPAQIADALGKVDAKAKGALRVLLHKMHKAGDVVQHADGRYTASQL